ncbi:MAG TPA: hypothetical protein VNB90_04630 [Cytophagaceae bacterium]|jgi:hypothetical protein|nr:hypothetical protein [Cytophagaceae bacterium]
MKFSFSTKLSLSDCQHLMNNISTNVLETGKFFDGKLTENKFQYNYTIFTSDTSGNIRKPQKMPYCTVAGQINPTAQGCMIEGNVTVVKQRIRLLTTIFALATIGLYLFLYIQKLPLLFSFFLPLGYGAIMIADIARFLSSKKEAVTELQKILSRY